MPPTMVMDSPSGFLSQNELFFGFGQGILSQQQKRNGCGYEHSCSLLHMLGYPWHVHPGFLFLFIFPLGRYPRLDLELPILLSSPVDDTEDDKEKWGVLGNDNFLASAVHSLEC